MDTFDKYEALEGACENIKSALADMDGINEFGDHIEVLNDVLEQMQFHLALLADDLRAEQEHEDRWFDRQYERAVL